MNKTCLVITGFLILRWLLMSYFVACRANVGTCARDSEMIAEILLKLRKSGMVSRGLRRGERIIKKTQINQTPYASFPPSICLLSMSRDESSSLKSAASVFSARICCAQAKTPQGLRSCTSPTVQLMCWEALFCPSNFVYTCFRCILFSACLCCHLIYQLFSPKGKKAKWHTKNKNEKAGGSQERPCSSRVGSNMLFHRCPCCHVTNCTSVPSVPHVLPIFPTGQCKVKGFVEWQLIQIIAFSYCLRNGNARALGAEDSTCTCMPYVAHRMPAAALL